MVGSAPELGGGINAVVQTYRRAGLFDRWNLRYVTSYRGKKTAMQLRTMAAAIPAVAWALLRGRVALMHVHSASRGSFWRKSLFCTLAHWARVPYVFHLHSGEFPHFYNRELNAIGRWWVRRVLRQAAAVAVLTPSWLAPVGRIEPGARLCELPNPVPLPLEVSVLRAVPQRVLFLGRLRESKGVFDLLRAIPVVLTRYPGIRFCLAGDGDLDAVQSAAVKAGVQSAIELPGWVDGERKDAELASADLLVLPSHFEGLPICVLEAMAHGVPVVATPVGGVPHALDQGRCGVLTPVGDDRALAEAMMALLGDMPRRRTLAVLARKRAEQLFSPPSACAALETLWRGCIGKSVAVPGPGVRSS